MKATGCWAWMVTYVYRRRPSTGGFLNHGTNIDCNMLSYLYTIYSYVYIIYMYIYIYVYIYMYIFKYIYIYTWSPKYSLNHTSGCPCRWSHRPLSTCFSQGRPEDWVRFYHRFGLATYYGLVLMKWLRWIGIHYARLTVRLLDSKIWIHE